MFAKVCSTLLIASFAIFTLSSVGCGSAREKKPKVATPTEGKKEVAVSETKHSGWWCQEHGVPEHLCSLCLPDAEVAKKFKDLGDWCKIHDRAQSQCFKCDPSKYAKFEAMHVAKYGKAPERPPEEEFTK